MTGQEQMPKQSLSPMENLTELFMKQNSNLDELISRLAGKLHRLSDTNVPQEANKLQEATDLPFRDGHLMYYYQQLKRNEGLICSLANEVNKLESLI